MGWGSPKAQSWCVSRVKPSSWKAMSDHKWHVPPGGTLGAQSLGQLQQAVNYPKGLHGDSFDGDLVLPGTGPGSRMMLVGPMGVPPGVTVSIQSGAVVKIL